MPAENPFSKPNHPPYRGNFQPQPEPIEGQDRVPFIPRNRMERRASRRLWAKEIPDFLTEFDKNYATVLSMQRAMNAEWSLYPDPTSMIFRGNTDFYAFVSIRHRIQVDFPRVKEINAADPFVTKDTIDGVEAKDIFSASSNGVTVQDMMHPMVGPDLSSEDLDKMNRLFTPIHFPRNLFQKEDPRIGEARLLLTYLAEQRFARPEVRTVIPDNIRPLCDRLTAYFDHYTAYFMDSQDAFYPASSIREFLSTFWSMSRTDGWVYSALGSYIPARLGITPSSTSKLILYKELAWGSEQRRFPNLVNRFLKNISNAFRPNALPSEIEPFQHYNQDADAQASQIITRFLLERDETGDVSVEDLESAEDVIDRLKKYHRAIQIDLSQAKRKNIRVISEGDSLASEVIIASQNPNTLLFVMRFKDDLNTHLTIEIDREGRLFGTPAELLYAYPNIKAVIATTLLEPVLSHFKRIHPNIEPAVIDPQTRVATEVPNPILTPKVEIKRPVQPKKNERRPQNRVLTPIQQTLEEAETTGFPEQPGRKLIVVTSRKQIKNMLPRNVREKDIDQIMQTIRGVEVGKVDFSDKIVGSDDIWEVKSKRYRIFFKHRNGKFYSVDTVGARQDNLRLFRR